MGACLSAKASRPQNKYAIDGSVSGQGPKRGSQNLITPLEV